jgi:hypothetical protein
MQIDVKSATHSRHFLRRSDAANYITERYGFPCSRQWLAKLAVIGGGPVFRKAGRYPVYEPNELDQWAAARTGRRSGRRRKSIRREPMGSRHPNPRLVKVPGNIRWETIACVTSAT